MKCQRCAFEGTDSMPVSIQTTLGHDEWLHDEAWWCASLLRARLEAVEAARAADIRAHGMAVAELSRLTRERDEARQMFNQIFRHRDWAIQLPPWVDRPTTTHCPECWGSKHFYRTDNDGNRHMYPCPSCANGGGGD